MIKKPMIYLLASVVIVVVAFLLMYRPLFTNPGQTTAKKMDETSVEPLTSATIFDTTATDTKGNSPGAEMKSLAELVAEYGDLQLIDAHNHDASGFTYARMMKTWEQKSVDRVVLFGDVSEPSAIGTDEISWNAYQEAPDQFIPFFSGINLLDESGLQTVKDNLEKGYFGIGEIAAASTNSPVLANVAWKTKDPMDGIFTGNLQTLCGI